MAGQYLLFLKWVELELYVKQRTQTREKKKKKHHL